MISLGVGDRSLDVEAAAIAHTLLSHTKKDSVVGVLQDEVGGADGGVEQVPSVSVTELYGVDLLANKSKNLVVVFCKEGELLQEVVESLPS